MNTIGIILIITAFVLLLIFVLFSIKIVRRTNVLIIERLGRYHKTLSEGINWILPFFDRVVLRVTTKEQVKDFPAQDVITKDNVTMKVDTVVYLQVTDPKLYLYGVVNPIDAVENMTATTLRNLIGDLELDQTLTSRDTVNEKLRTILDGATDPWGIKILRVELKNLLPPRDIVNAMEKQMRAEREKREKILQAEGEKEATILRAQGYRTAVILKAEAEKEKRILEAEGKKKSIELLNSAKPTPQSLIIKSYETLSQVANSNSSTLIIPSELTNITSISKIFNSINDSTKQTMKLDSILNDFNKKNKGDY